MADHRYLLAKSSLPEAKGVLMGRYIHNGSVGKDEFAGKMSDGRTNMDKPSALLMLDGFGTGVKNLMPSRIDLGDIVLEPAIEGSVPSLDSPLGPENRIYLDVRLGSSLRNCLSDITPVRVSADEVGYTVSDVVDIVRLKQRRTIIGCRPFAMEGVGLSVNGEGEGVKVVSDIDGTSVVAVYDSDEGTGQRITMHLPTALPAGTAKVMVTTRGFRADESEQPFELEPFKVTVLAGDAPVPPGDGPEIERGYSEGEGHSDGQVYPYYAFILQGVNLDGAAVKIGYTEGGTYREVDVPDEKLTVTDTVITIASDSVELEDATASGSATVTFKVTTAGGTATYEAEVQQ